MIDHIFALLDASLAPRTSPAASLLPTCDAYTIATMPVGRKQKSVTRIAHTRWLGTLAGGNIGPRGYRLPTPWPGIGGGGSPAPSGGGAISDRSHVCPPSFQRSHVPSVCCCHQTPFLKTGSLTIAPSPPEDAGCRLA